ncbi:cysteate synthase [Ancylomarina sp. 16SWW S1-10-2]|uniref:cysteate synthase n=1 Tax=Ancylomarina sp. 16SWW S1-10-2 TaxID=2499681 RepID=UPI0012AD6F98|nr:cysteate synthase [Ancylomarina sp. 16SWW S1-10-2]MRT94552.1 cysteate synthase [Ancylomarina sp. 16SWW S1-10-2]
MTKEFQATQYRLESVKSGKRFDDEGWTLDAPGESDPSLIRAIYEKKQLEVKDKSFGIYRFADWLPIHKILEGSSAPATYKSEGLAKYLGLNNLHITFSGYWPEKGANFRTCSFKETEAYTVCGRLNSTDQVLVVASAGNTARAFARVCSDNNIPLLLTIPEDNLSALWFDEPIKDNVRVIATKSGSDYFDAIHLSNIACELDGFLPEGGAKNIARRDGMGTTVLSAVNEIGQIPDYYFQAIGSGTGAIAAWEANLRFIEDGRYGDNKMKLMVSQNAPFLPIYNAWKADSRAMLPLEDVLARKQVEDIDAKVLSNRKPPYPIVGGLYDALKDAGGDVLSATNQETLEAGKIFLETEGNDIHPAAAVAVATLIREAKAGNLDKDACIMLNITGGGEEKIRREKEVTFLKASHIFDINPDKGTVKEVLDKLFESSDIELDEVEV